LPTDGTAVDRALADLVRFPNEEHWSALATGLRLELGASAIRINGCSPPQTVAEAGEPPESRPQELRLTLRGRVVGSIEVWPPDVALDSPRMESMAASLSLLLDHDSMVKAGEKFVHDVAHELRGALVRASNMAQILSRSGQINEEGREIEKHMVQNLSHAEALLRQLTVFATANSQREPVREFNLISIAETVRWNLKPVLAEAGATFEIEGPGHVIRSREAQISDAVYRVAENAGKFGAKTIAFRTAEQDGGVLISVDDDGPGIEEPYREQVFDPFYRLHGKKYPGHGLGLAIARRLIENNGGRVWVEPGNGSGTSVRMWLPESPLGY
jgi:signal transduction histidine kinase